MSSATTTPRAADWFATHRATLDGAREAIRTRGFYSAYFEVPSAKAYGETAAAEGKAAFDARIGKPFVLDQPGTTGLIGSERSPFGIELGVSYPKPDVDALISAANAGLGAWTRATIDERAGVLLEMLARINKHSFEMAHAVMHTTGQGFGMAFQAGGPHAQDRALEAIAYAYEEMSKIPARVLWEKPQGKNEPLRIEKTFRIVGRGIDLTIGCSTFPTWNSYPGVFASLATGNAVIVKPHPQAILPLAISVEAMRGTLRDAGFDPNLVQLAVDSLEAPIAKALIERPEIAIVDYTGGSAFGDWVEKNAHGPTYTEKAGVNAIVIESTANFKGMLRNIAMSVSLYSGQMCTTPQNIFVPRGGIEADGAHVSFDDVVGAIAGAVDSLLAAPERAFELLGAIAMQPTLDRVDAENGAAGVVLASKTLTHPDFPHARVRTPLVAKLDVKDAERFGREMFGPIVYVIATDDVDQALAISSHEARTKGAITAIVHSTDPAVLAKAEDAAAYGRVSLGENLTGALMINQSSAFSDYHVTGGNPAGNASLTDAAFVANRFRIIETRTPASA
jgi:phenylacetic acid degradation protein paaN